MARVVPVRFSVTHVTRYSYSEPVAVSHNTCHLAPRDLSYQRVQGHRIEISPTPTAQHQVKDWFGNTAHVVSVQSPHTELVVTSTSTIERLTPPWPLASVTLPWEVVAEQIRLATDPMVQSAVEFSYPSPMLPVHRDLLAFIQPLATPGRPALELALALNHLINEEFTYDPSATDVTTPVIEALANRHGVCQDFALVMIGALRSLGLPARYVSGYLETTPPPGRPRMVGADASHAWAQVWVGDPRLGDGGWVDLDPTNDCLPGERHLTVAIGRDFADVSPLRGLILGGGKGKVHVAVDVTRW